MQLANYSYNDNKLITMTLIAMKRYFSLYEKRKLANKQIPVKYSKENWQCSTENSLRQNKSRGSRFSCSLAQLVDL